MSHWFFFADRRDGRDSLHGQTPAIDVAQGHRLAIAGSQEDRHVRVDGLASQADEPDADAIAGRRLPSEPKAEPGTNMGAATAPAAWPNRAKNRRRDVAVLRDHCFLFGRIRLLSPIVRPFNIFESGS